MRFAFCGMKCEPSKQSAIFFSWQDPDRQNTMSRHEDLRVDVCLYFIAPHAFTRSDCDTIKMLSKRVPVIPILAKVDVQRVHCIYAPSLPLLNLGAALLFTIRGCNVHVVKHVAAYAVAADKFGLAQQGVCW